MDLSHIKLPQLKVVTSDTLFPPDFSLVKKNKCPKCGLTLYWNYERTTIRCKSKKHKTFILTKKKYEDMASGKSLEDWRAFNQDMKK